MKKRLSSSYFWISRVSIFVFIKNEQVIRKSCQIFSNYSQEQSTFHRQITEQKEDLLILWESKHGSKSYIDPKPPGTAGSYYCSTVRNCQRWGEDERRGN
jgi:hypothetical protein